MDGILNADLKVFPDAVQIAELNYLTISCLTAGTDHPPQNDQTAAKQEHPALRAAFRGQGTGHGDSPYVGADRGSDLTKKDQVLLTIRSRDFSFVLEEKFARRSSRWSDTVSRSIWCITRRVTHLCVDNSWHIDEAIQASETRSST